MHVYMHVYIWEFIKAVTKRARNIPEKMDDFFAARIDIYDTLMLHNVESGAEEFSLC